MFSELLDLPEGRKRDLESICNDILKKLHSDFHDNDENIDENVPHELDEEEKQFIRANVNVKIGQQELDQDINDLLGDIENSEEELNPSDRFDQDKVEDFNSDLEKKRKEFEMFRNKFKPQQEVQTKQKAKVANLLDDIGDEQVPIIFN